jgi:hypothetical protein
MYLSTIVDNIKTFARRIYGLQWARGYINRTSADLSHSTSLSTPLQIQFVPSPPLHCAIDSCDLSLLDGFLHSPLSLTCLSPTALHAVCASRFPLCVPPLCPTDAFQTFFVRTGVTVMRPLLPKRS